MPIAVFRPAERRAVPHGVDGFSVGTPFYQETDRLQVAGEGGLVERGGVGMKAGRVVPVGVFTGIEEEADDLDVAELGGEGQSGVPGFLVRAREKALGVGQASKA